MQDQSKAITRQPLPTPAVEFDVLVEDRNPSQRPLDPNEINLQNDDNLCHLVRLATVNTLYIREFVAMSQAVGGNFVAGEYEILDENMKLLYMIPRRKHPGCCATWCTCCFNCYICCCDLCINYFKGWSISDPTGRRPVVQVNTVNSMFANYVGATNPESDESFGSVFQCCPILRPFDNYSVRLQKKRVLSITGPSCFDLMFVNTCGRLEYSIQNKEGETVGGITRKALGQLSNSDEFTLTFPVDLDVRTKATLMTFVLFVDYTYLENRTHIACSQCCSSVV